MKKIIFTGLIGTIFFSGCKKNDAGLTNTTTDFNTLQATVITNFVNNVALPGYVTLQANAATLNTAVINLNAAATEANLTTAKTAWKNMRVTWEQCEGYLFGPVEDNEYDQETDTWPVDYVQMDSLLKSNNTLTLTDINSLSVRSLKGYHPIEYILFGQGGTRTAASITARQKLYVVSLSQHLKNIADALYNSWAPTSGNYAAQVLTAGAASNTQFPKKQDVFVAITNAMIDICNEVATGKMYEPWVTSNPGIVESPFAGTSAQDFKNNIVGAYNVYLGRFNTDGIGINQLVSAKNISLDNEITLKFQTAIGAFDNITIPYEQAIISQRVQCQNVMTAINDLKTTLDTKLSPFVLQYITN